MNYYNPLNYMSSIPNMANAAQAASGIGTAARSGGFLSSIFKNGLNWGSILNNTHRTLGVINQAIPVVKQVTPMFNNMKTVFKVINEFKKGDISTTQSTQSDTLNNNEKPEDTTISSTPTKTVSTPATNSNYTYVYEEGPTFFI